MVELSTESYVLGHHVYKRTLPGSYIHVHAYTVNTLIDIKRHYTAAVVLRKQLAASSLLLCQRGTLTIVDSTLTRFLTEERLETWTRTQTHFCRVRGHNSAILRNLIWRWLSKSANPPNLIPRQIFQLYGNVCNVFP